MHISFNPYKVTIFSKCLVNPAHVIYKACFYYVGMVGKNEKKLIEASNNWSVSSTFQEIPEFWMQYILRTKEQTCNEITAIHDSYIKAFDFSGYICDLQSLITGFHKLEVILRIFLFFNWLILILFTEYSDWRMQGFKTSQESLNSLEILEKIVMWKLIS